MKDNPLDGHRGKVALSDSSTRNNSTAPSKCDLKSPGTSSTTTTTSTANDGTASATNFDDDYNEWELGIGDLIIDLDADIEKTNERNGIGSSQQGITSQHGHHHHHHGHHHQNGISSSPDNGPSTGNNSSIISSSPNSASAATTFNFLGTQTSCNNNSNLAAAMSSSKSPRLTVNSGVGSGISGSTGSAASTGSGNSGTNATGSGTFEHQATVDKGLKMKIKRKTVGNKYSEAKHEIVQSDTKSANSAQHANASDSAGSANGNNCSSSASNSPATSSDTPKSKHSSSKGRNSSHREKKEKNRDKDKGSGGTRNSTAAAAATTTPAPEVNGVLGVMSSLKILNSDSNVSSPAPPSLSSNPSPLPATNSSAVAIPSVSRAVTTTNVANPPASINPTEVVSQAAALVNLPNQTVSASSSPPMPNLTLKLEPKFSPSPIAQSCPVPPVVIKPEDRPASPPLKKIKLESPDQDEEIERSGTPDSIEMKDTSTCTTSTSVGTITEPDCLGPCEPGTSVMLEGIVWQETEGGVLVVNVTWRGKTYVGTLLDCTKHDWAPPRFCESPTSDVDSKTGKGRGKRGRGGNNSSSEVTPFADTRNCVQSKLRNGKGRRTTLNSNAANSGFTVPNSPAKNENGSSNGKRKGRPTEPEPSTPADSKNSKRSRTQSRTMLTPATTTSPAPAASPLASAEPSQPPTNPSSPQWITCPEPNCSKRYKHINGLKYHKAHAHSASDSSSKLDDTATEDSKDVTNSSDNEESLQESASVSTSPAPSFTNSVPSHTSGGKIVLNSESTSSSSSSVNGLPESDSYSLTTDLSTLAAVAIGDSAQKLSISALHSTASQDISIVSPDGENALPPTVLPVSVSSESSIPALHSDALSATSPAPCLSTAVSAVTTSVIQSSNSLENIAASQGVAMNIPGSHVIFNNQGVLGSNNTTTCGYTSSSSVVSDLPIALSPSNTNMSSNVTTTTFSAISSIVSTTIASPSTSLPMLDKNKIKQERPDKYKPKSPLATTAIRPIVPAPTPLISLSTNIPGSHPGMTIGSHCVNSPLKPIQPKPTILGEPNTVNPTLESLKKEKSKHKKKSKDKERDKKLSSIPLTPTKLGMNPGEECEALELTSYPSLEAVSGPLSNPTHPTLSPLISQVKPPETSIDLSLPDDTMNENVQSPAYSDISDANDTAPVLESEVPSGKEKEDKIGKLTPDASQSPAANISAYGMYPYYSQPPYLLPSVSPQAAVSGPQGPNVIEKNELSKKTDSDRAKENRPWSNPSGDVRERQHLDHHELEKKQQTREENVQNASPAASGVPMQDYPIPQHYPYPYGYVQGYPYPVDSSSYHMHMLESDPHYKQQYKQYLDEHHRMYKEQQHHQQQQQQIQHMQQIHHHQQQQQQQQHQQQQSHHSHHSQHQSSYHQSKSHHSSMKEERDRDRSRESKDRSGNAEKMTSGGIISEHSSKIQHSSNPMVSSKDQEVREIEMRPPSLPAQSRGDSSSSASSLKEKQNENHQILKENIELKSQMDDSKNKINQYEMAMLYERHKEDMRRFYMGQDRLIEQQQQKMEPGLHHHTHHHQTIQSHSSYSSSSSSAKPFKDDISSSVPIHSKSNHYGDSTRSSPAKSEHIKSLHSSTSSPKCNPRDRDSSLSSSKEYMNSSSGRESSSSKKEGSKGSERSESSSGREEKKEKIKTEVKAEPEGQKPTMETTGPPPPPTNSYAYLHPSYLQPPPPHFAHMPFEPAHAMYRGGINPMIVSTPHYANSPYMHPQIRYVTPGACELPVHPPPVQDPMAGKLHPTGPPKALDLLHQVSQQYTNTHKIHELTEHAVMSPTPTSTPSSTPSTSSSSTSGKTSSSEPVVAVSKGDGSRDASRSPPTQRHLHTHHHTHVGVGYPIYDPYGAIIAPGTAPPVECKPIHPMQVKPPPPAAAASGARFWP